MLIAYLSDLGSSSSRDVQAAATIYRSPSYLAMPPKKALAQLGQIEEHGTTFRVHIQYRDAQNKRKQHIRGPLRVSNRRAENDLAAFRSTAATCATWDDGIAAMEKLSVELHLAALKEARVALGLEQYLSQQMAHKVEDSDSESAESVGAEAGDGYIWEDADFSDPKVLEKLFPPPAPKQGPTQPPQDASEATARLAWFQFAKETPDALHDMLIARADPNVVEGEGDHPPLWNAMNYADNAHVHAMRDLLIQYGAKNGKVELARWRRRQEADRIDPIFLRNFHRSAAA